MRNLRPVMAEGSRLSPSAGTVSPVLSLTSTGPLYVLSSPLVDRCKVQCTSMKFLFWPLKFWISHFGTSVGFIMSVQFCCIGSDIVYT